MAGHLAQITNGIGNTNDFAHDSMINGSKQALSNAATPTSYSNRSTSVDLSKEDASNAQVKSAPFAAHPRLIASLRKDGVTGEF